MTTDTQATLKKIAQREQAAATNPTEGADMATATQTKPAAKRTRKPAAKPAAKATPKAKPQAKKAPATPVAFEWPQAPGKLLNAYLTARVTADEDGPARKQPFIGENGVLRVHSSDWVAWLGAQGIHPGKSVAAAPLRDAGLGVRSFPIPGESFAYGFYTGPAPKGTEKLPRRKGAARAPRATRPFGTLTADQKQALYVALAAYEFSPEEAAIAAARDELLVLLPE
jgi:hypothetical protein